MSLKPFAGKKILLLRTDRLGDLILSFPVVEALKAFLPDARIDLVAHPSTAPLARLQKNITRVISFASPGPGSLMPFTGYLRKEGYDAAVHLYPRPGFALATFLACTPFRVGTAYRFYSLLYNRRRRIHRKHMTLHERDLNLLLLEALGIPFQNVSAGLSVPERAKEHIREVLSSVGIAQKAPFVVLHPGSGGSSLNWPPEHYGTLGRMLLEKNVPVVLTGSEADREPVSTTWKHTDKRAVELCGKLDLEHLAALLVEASLTISNSTGPLHLADALGGKVIGLYSPHFYSSPQRWGPYGQMEHVLVPHGKSCRRCREDRCAEFNCMASIPPEAVLQMAERLLAEEQGSTESPEYDRD